MLKGLINLITFIRFRKGKAHAKASTFVSSAHPANHVAQRRLRASFKLHFYQIASVTDYAGYFESGTLTNRGEVLFAPARSIRPIAKAFSSGAKEC